MRFSKMEPDTRVQKNCLKAAYGNERGIVLAVVLMFLVILGAMGSAAVMKTRGAIKISDNYKDSEEMFYAAQAGTGVNPIGWTVTGLKLECPPGWLN